MYCMTTKKNPKLAKKRMVIPTAPRGEVGSAEQTDIQQRVPAPQFDHRKRGSERETGCHATPDDRMRPSAHMRFHHPEHEHCDGGADQRGAHPVQRSGRFVAR
jgi:hypothetical protein